MSLPLETVELKLDVPDEERCLYQADVCPYCASVVYVPSRAAVEAPDWTPVAEAECPRCGLRLRLVVLTQQRLLCTGFDDSYF